MIVNLWHTLLISQYTVRKISIKMEKVLIIFQDIIRYSLSAVTRKHEIQCVIKNAGKKRAKINTEYSFILTS